MQTKLKVAVMGQSGVGKSCLIRRLTGRHPMINKCILHGAPQFHLVNSEDRLFYNKAESTANNCTCKRNPPTNVTLAYNHGNAPHLIHTAIREIPEISNFPQNAFEEWDNEEIRSLSSSHIFILVFDVSKSATLQYVKRIKSQIIQRFTCKYECESIMTESSNLIQCSLKHTEKLSRNFDSNPYMPGIIVVGNKCDLVQNVQNLVPIFRHTKRGRRLSRWDTIYSTGHKHMTYLECSSSLNYNIEKIFYDVIKIAKERNNLNVSDGQRNSLLTRIFKLLVK